MNPFKDLSRQERRLNAKQLRKDNAKVPMEWRQIPREEWPKAEPPRGMFELWHNRKFICQVYEAPNGIIRLSVNRAEVIAGGHWRADIGWEELQAIKNAVGYADRDAVEIFPAESDVVNVANMRHLWVLPERLDFIWRDRNALQEVHR